MRYRKQEDYTGDFTFGYGYGNFYDGNMAVAQAIKTKILLFYGEWWENLGLGIPMFQSIIGQTNRNTVNIAAQSLLRKRILEVKEVTSIVELKAEVNGREFYCSIVCKTDNDETVRVEVRI